MKAVFVNKNGRGRNIGCYGVTVREGNDYKILLLKKGWR